MVLAKEVGFFRRIFDFLERVFGGIDQKDVKWKNEILNFRINRYKREMVMYLDLNVFKVLENGKMFFLLLDQKND